jgi:hypothetical protein
MSCKFSLRADECIYDTDRPLSNLNIERRQRSQNQVQAVAQQRRYMPRPIITL